MRDLKKEEHHWQSSLAQGFNSAKALLHYLELPSSLAEPLAEQTFKTRVPRGFADRMQRGDPNDPLLLQVLAVAEELVLSQAYSSDPLMENEVNLIPGLIHKYTHRVLLTVTGACAINCRYCFRRHFPYHMNNPGQAGWDVAMAYIQNDPNINEVILSGGDPLLTNDTHLAQLLEKVTLIPHIKTIRIHTRIPIVLPERINDALRLQLNKIKLNKVIVLHCNHPQELDSNVKKACYHLREAGCHLLNQSVFLKGINDQVDVLSALSERLFEYGVLPYYLHVLDKVQGAAHFDSEIEEVLKVYRALQAVLPGYLVPRLTKEEPGKKHKTLLF